MNSKIREITWWTAAGLPVEQESVRKGWKNMEEQVREILKELCRLDLTEEEKEKILQNKDCNLKEELGFDSLLMVELIIEIEEQLGFEFEAEEMDMKRLRSYQNLLELVKRHENDRL